MTEDSSHAEQPEPLATYRTMFEAEVRQAVAELQRPSTALLASGVIAGACVGITVLILGLLVHLNDGIPETIGLRLVFGSVYAVGFVFAILARADLFTEYTTIAILPILTGDGQLRLLARLWGLIYVGNLIGGGAMGLVVVALGPALGVYETGTLGLLSGHVAGHPWWVVLVSATLAGWLMGLLSWLIAGGRDTTSQILFIWVVGTVIGALGLHHSITGGIELLAGTVADGSTGWADLVQVMFWMTLGNAIGGILFALLIKQSVRMDAKRERGGDRKEGRDQQRARRT